MKVEEFNKVSYVHVVRRNQPGQGEIKNFLANYKLYHLSMCAGQSMEEAWNINGSTQVWYSMAV